ncbi:MAG: hypothetical protein Unbinned6284contig1004_18 [Prokaryotic dsDNA virus sp.]|nr:MAG: hypothetical protein Unbinned6284contig1004_18 [Prokaryotic dsDNA virus sp.]
MNFLINITTVIYSLLITIDNIKYLLIDDYVRSYYPISIYVVIILWCIYDNTKK